MATTTSAQTDVQRCFYTLWGRDRPEDRVWEPVPNQDLVAAIVDGSGRQDWRKLRPFDLLPDVDPAAGGAEQRMLYAGDALRVACQRLAGPQLAFQRAGDYQTVLFQFSGVARVETSFGPYELWPGEALLVPAMVAYRVVGSPHCRQMIFLTRDRLEPKLDPEKATTDIRYAVRRADEDSFDEQPPGSAPPPTGKVLERLSRWNGAPADDYLFERTYEWMVGKAESGPRPVKARPFNFFPTPPDSSKVPVRWAMLWEGPSFRQNVYANPGRQPAPHRGYDEDELWLQFTGVVDQETEHAAYPIAMGETSMAEAGISHTSTNHPGSLRLTTYTNSPIRLVANPGEHLRESRWELRETVARGWTGE